MMITRRRRLTMDEKMDDEKSMNHTTLKFRS